MKALLGTIMVVVLAYFGLVVAFELVRRADVLSANDPDFVALEFRARNGRVFYRVVDVIVNSGQVAVEESSHWPQEWFTELQKVPRVQVTFAGEHFDRTGFYKVFKFRSSSLERETEPSLSTQILTGFPERQFVLLQPEMDVLAARFIPPGYTILDHAYGDLDGDKFEDAIVILENDNKKKQSGSDVNSAGRRLLILTGKRWGATSRRWDGFQLAAESDSTVYCRECGGMLGDPYSGVVIKDGYFSVEHQGGSSWRWTRIITYKYSRGKEHWFLHRDGGSSYHTSDPENVEHQMKTEKDFGVVRFEDFDINAG